MLRLSKSKEFGKLCTYICTVDAGDGEAVGRGPLYQRRLEGVHRQHIPPRHPDHCCHTGMKCWEKAGACREILPSFQKCNFLMNHPVRRSVGRSVCHNFLKGRRVTLPCFYRSTWFISQRSREKR